ncbi:hypothetical protein D3C78_1882960 [compost metagenome]
MLALIQLSGALGFFLSAIELDLGQAPGCLTQLITKLALFLLQPLKVGLLLLR